MGHQEETLIMTSPSDNGRESKDYVLQMAKEHDVKFIRLWFTDILGSLKSVAITVEELATALDEGVGFDGSSIEGAPRVAESDMIAMPAPTTFALLPWRPKEDAVARMFCDILHPDGRPFEGDPRYILRRNLKRAADLGFTFYVGPELEYFYFANSEGTELLDQGGYFDLTPLDAATDLRRETVRTPEKLGIRVEAAHHEVAPSQHASDPRSRGPAGDQPVGDLLQAAGAGLRGAGVPLVGAPQPLGSHPGAGVQAGEGERDAHRAPRRRSGLQPVSGVLGDAGRRAGGDREGVPLSGAGGGGRGRGGR